MAQTVIGLFDTTSEAQQAIQDLTNAGFSRDSIDLSAGNAGGTTGTASTTTSTTATDTGDSVSNFFNSLFGTGEEATRYSEVARSSGSVVTVHAQTADEAARATDILDRYNAIDVDERYNQYTSTTGANYAATNVDTDVNRTATTEGTMAIPVVEETLAVGKRAVEGGGVRVRSRVIERPVEESIRLREERVIVDRRPVNRAATDADFNTATTGDMTITERSEQAVVGKEARVVEEVVVGKDVSERTETVRDTVRSTDVDVEQIDTVNTTTDVDTTTDINTRTNNA